MISSSIALSSIQSERLSSAMMQTEGKPSVTLKSTATTYRESRSLPNFRDFSPADDPLTPRNFSTSPRSPIPLDPGTSSPQFVVGPAGEPVLLEHPPNLSDDPDESFDPRHPAHLSEAAVEAFSHTAARDSLSPMDGSPSEEREFTNYSQSGIVHLPPIAPNEPRSSSVGSAQGRNRIGYDGALVSPSLDAGETEVIQMSSTQASRADSPTTSISPSVQASTRSITGTASSEGPHITFRYQHVEDENGHHLIVGREGSLTRCEDEVSVCFLFLVSRI